MRQYIVKTGIHYYGPFPTVAEAVQWAQQHGHEWPQLPVDFTVIELKGAT
jgi:hypothetical protein